MEYQFDYFISYSHKDNVSENGQPGFVDEFVEKLCSSDEHKKMFGGEMKVFFDKSEIHSMSDWDTRIRSSLAKSRFFVVLLSPNYFQSEYCAREFDWWMQHEMHRRLLGEATAPMKIVTVEEIDEDNPEKPAISDDLKNKFPNWMTLLRQIQSGPDFDMRHLYRAKIDETLRALRQNTKDKVFKQNIAEDSPTNTGRYPDYNHNFVGRRDDLSFLRQSLSTKSSVAISAVNGLGGIGKTELAITYGHAFAWDYGLGRVFAKCEDQTSLDSVLLSCGIAEMYGVKLKGKNEQKIAQLYTALAEQRKTIIQRNIENNIEDETIGTHLLLILDNMNKTELVSQEQLRKLPPYFHVIITTREPTNRLGYIETKSLGKLSKDESIELLSNLRSFGTDPREAKAARDIAELLDGFTLAVEITGAYLKERPKQTYQKQFKFLRKNLSKAMKWLVSQKPGLQFHRPECVSVILKPTLRALSPNARKALNFAALMPPDVVALGWLQELVDKCPQEDYYQITAAFDWFMKLIGLKKNHDLDIIDELTGYNLLTPLEGETNIARIHRLVAESLTARNKKQEEIIAIIREKCNDLLKEEEQFWSVQENTWNIIPVSEFLKLLAERWKVETSEEEIDWDLTRMMDSTGNILSFLDKINEAYETLRLCYKVCKERYKSFPDNNDVFQDYFSSCNNLQKLQALFILRSEQEKSAGNDIAAQENLEKSQKISQEIQDDFLEIRQKLADMMTDDAVMNKVKTSKMKYSYDYFISYSRADNMTEDGIPGFVDEFVSKLENFEEHQRLFGKRASVFFDKSEIHSMSEWDDRIRSSLASSRFLILLISPNYFKSEYCAREFDWWIKHEMHCRALGESVFPLLILPVAGLYDFNETPFQAVPQDLQDKFPNWGSQIQQLQTIPDFDIHSLNHLRIDEAVQSLSHSIKDKVIQQMMADYSPINTFYPRYNENFVGRNKNLRSLHQALTTMSSSAICALTGLGGIGKTELALTYGHAFAWEYGLGRVFVNCENATSLSDILLSSGIAEMNGWELPKGTSEQQLEFLFSRLKVKMDEIIQRNHKEGAPKTLGTHILLILDNVNRLELISQEQLDRLLPDYFHVIITTRITPSDIPYIYSESVDSLSADESVELLSNLRSFGSDEAEITAARQIAQSLDGVPLVLELTGTYLASNPVVTYQQQYKNMVVSNPEIFQVTTDRTIRLARHFAEVIAITLESTLSALSDNALKALNFASLMAPDAIGLDWLPELCGLTAEDGGYIRYELTNYSLLTPLESEPNIARIHRLTLSSLKIPEEERKKIIAKIRAKCNDLLEEDEKFWRVPENSWNIIPVYEFLKLLGKNWTVETSDKDIDWDLTRMMISSGKILINLGKNIEAMDVYKIYHGICKKRADAMPENVQLWLDYSVSCNKLGDLENVAGNAVTARKFYEKALEISNRLVIQMPNDVDVQRYLSFSYNSLGDLEKAAGNVVVAREFYEKALEIEQRLANLKSDDIDIQRDLSASYDRLGNLESNIGNSTRAQEWYEKALDIYKQLANKSPDSVDTQRSLSFSYNCLGDLKNNTDSREWYEKSLEINKRLADIMPDNVGVQRDLGVSYERLGNMEKALGNSDAARDRFEKSMEIHKQLSEKMAENLSAQWDLGVSYNNLGDLEKAAGNVDAARTWFEKALEIEQRLADLMPDDIRVHRILNLSFNRLGNLEQEAGNSTSAKTWYEKALKIEQRLADHMPDNVTAQRDLSAAYNNLGDLEKAAGNVDAARTWFEKALKIEQRLADLMPDDIRVHRILNLSFNRLGNLEKDAGNTVVAREWYEKALQIEQRLVDLMPDDIQVQRHWAISCERLGDLEKDNGNADIARDWYEKALRIRERLAKAMPDNIQALQDLSFLYNRLGDLEKAAGNDSAAREWYEKGLEIFQHIDEVMQKDV